MDNQNSLSMLLLFLLLSSCRHNLAATVTATPASPNGDSIWITIQTPDVIISKSDVSLCKTFRLPGNGSYDVVEFIPEPNPNFENHMNIYLCKEPAVFPSEEEDYVWNCFGEDFNVEPGHRSGTICQDGQENGMFVTFNNKDDNSIRLPDDVAFKAGQNSGFKYIVMATHYPELGSEGPKRSGHSQTRIRMIPDPDGTSKRMMMSGFNLNTWAIVAGNQPDASYVYDQGIPMHPIAFLAHTHHLATDFEIWRRPAASNESVLMWKQNPQHDIRFHVLSKQPPIEDGEELTLHCEYNTTGREEPLRIQVEEMCSAVLMYAVDGHELIPRQSIVTIRKEDMEKFPQGPEEGWWWNYF